jgi:hypothetical protein
MRPPLEEECWDQGPGKITDHEHTATATMNIQTSSSSTRSAFEAIVFIDPHQRLIFFQTAPIFSKEKHERENQEIR